MNAYVSLLAALCGALAGASAGWFVEIWKRRRESANALNLLFAELKNLCEHYGYAATELPRDASSTDELPVRTALAWSKYGDLAAVKSLQTLGFIGAAEIQLLLQISLRVRNNDTLIELLLADLNRATPARLNALHGRMKYIYQSSMQLLDQLVRQQPQFNVFRPTTASQMRD